MSNNQGVLGLDYSKPLDIENLPATLRNSMPSDPSRDWPGAPPFGGEDLVPHIYTTSGYVGSAARTYPIEDECLRNSWENSERMRTCLAIRESLEARYRAVSGLKWHIQPEDDSDKHEVELCNQLTKIVNRIPHFLDMKMWLMEALFTGRAAVFNNFKSIRVKDNRYIGIGDWEPRHGDKLMFRYGDGTQDYQKGQLGIRVHATWAVANKRIRENVRSHISPTQYGLVYFLDQDERDTVVVHRHMIEDGPFQDPRALGRINGVGIRDRIYWTWFAMVGMEVDLLTFLGRSALGVRLWRCPSGSPEWKKRIEEAAKSAQQNGYTDIIFPVEPNEFANLYGVEQLEPGMGGAQMLGQLIQDYYMTRIKRYILGQTSTSESAASGMGSGVAEAHLATFADIVTYDATKLSETITTDLIRPLIKKNFPEMIGHYPKFVLDTENADASRLMMMLQQAWAMGAEINKDDLYGIMGSKKPTPSDTVLKNPQILLAELQVKQAEQQMELASQMQTQQAAAQQQGGPVEQQAGQPSQGGHGSIADAQEQSPPDGQQQPGEQQQPQAEVQQDQMPDSLAETHRVDSSPVQAQLDSPSKEADPNTESTVPGSHNESPTDTMVLVRRLITPRFLKEVKEQILQLA